MATEQPVIRMDNTQQPGRAARPAGQCIDYPAFTGAGGLAQANSASHPGLVYQKPPYPKNRPRYKIHTSLRLFV
jgi:hypothetical protein